MLLRDKQDFEERRQQIIDGALQVFASKGFEKATNKEIAMAAGIGSPGLIYHYFKDKSDLFGQVIEQRLPLLQLLAHSEEIVTKAPQDVLTLFGEAFLKVSENPTSIAVMKVLLGEAFRQPQVTKLINTIGPSCSYAFLTRYLAQQMSVGVLKSIDPGVAARCFLGPLIAYLLTREILVQPDTQQIKAEMMVRTTVEVFLQGMQVSPPDADC
jgi:AcrR family transcriptional regulator